MTWGLATLTYSSHTQDQTNYNTRMGQMLDTIVSAGAAASPAQTWTKYGPYNYNGAGASPCVWGKARHTSGAEIAFSIDVDGGSTNEHLHVDNTYLGSGTGTHPQYYVAFKPAEGSGTLPTGNNPYALSTFCRDEGCYRFRQMTPAEPHSDNRKMHVIAEGSRLIIMWEQTIGTVYGISFYADSASGEGMISSFANAGDTKGQAFLCWLGSSYTPGTNNPQGSMTFSTAGDEDVTTSGSSTTITTTNNAFDILSVGDTIIANSISRVVTAKASDISATVNTAVDWSSGYSFVAGALEESVVLEGRNTYLNSTINPSSPWYWENLVAWKNSLGLLKGLVDTDIMRRVGTHVSARQQLESGTFLHVDNGMVTPWEATFGPIP